MKIEPFKAADQAPALADAAGQAGSHLLETTHGGPDALGVPVHDFSTNANACGPCPDALDALRRADFARYPDPSYAALRRQLAGFHGAVRVADPRHLWKAFRLHDVLICQLAYLSAMADYAEQGGASRGSALYTDLEKGNKPYPELPDTFTFRLDDGGRGDLTQEALYQNGDCAFSWRQVRPIPEDDDFFENVWRAFRETGNID